ncbi:MAG: tyrosine decarboxylase MfnA [Thermoplasmatales archaeon]|nr:tyrosine decarboxylase MfnA [Thermoplasmatales archaeon]
MIINDKKIKYKNILKKLDKYKNKDFTFSSGKIIGSMCTQPHEISTKAYIKFLDTNLGDPELFPGTNEIEIALKKYILKLLNAPKTARGITVSGGTEGNITAMWLAKELTKKNEIILSKSAHFSFKKIASLINMKIITIPLTKNYVIDINKIKNKINDNTAAIIGIAGSTELGTIDSIPQLSDISLDENIFLHVDAAFGGFIIPFLKNLNYEVTDFDFNLKGVNSISIDAHKMGYSAIPLGLLAVRKKNWLDKISVESHCINSKKQTGILGTRSGGPVAAAYAVTKFLGKKGYTKLIENCMNLTIYVESEINKIGLELITKPTMNVLGIKIKNLDEVYKKLSDLGWKVNKIDRISCLRIVVMPHISKKSIDEFIPILKKVCMEVGEI